MITTHFLISDLVIIMIKENIEIIGIVMDNTILVDISVYNRN